MSHLAERKEKVCLNCNAELYGRYCHKCGQENLEPKETIWHLVNHFFQDITHFDGKFFSTVKYLLTKPGFLSVEYVKGRRASYLNPIRMYVFTSAFFFLIFFSMSNADSIMKLNETPDKKEGISDWQKQKVNLEKQLDKARKDKDEDSVDVIEKLEITNEKISAAKRIYGDTSTRKFSEAEMALLIVRKNMDSLENVPAIVHKAMAKQDSAGADRNYGFIDSDKKKYASPEAYDSAEAKLSPGKRDGWLKRMIIRKLIAVNNEFKKDKRSFFEKTREKFFHSFPKILFISLPFFALILQLVYIRRKQFYYTSHGIFAIHLYCATFLLLLVIILFAKLYKVTHWAWLQPVVVVIEVGIWIYILVYLYKAMRKFYGQGRFKTILKYLIVNFLAFIIDIILLLIFVLISVISI
ncbi:MAG TPA: DUF3667 domain-containing protein [Puia sp.]|nr:DUF3667 domain-containing protein [Puia sp.]